MRAYECNMEEFLDMVRNHYSNVNVVSYFNPVRGVYKEITAVKNGKQYKFVAHNVKDKFFFDSNVVIVQEVAL